MWTVLHVEDNDNDALLLRMRLKRCGLPLQIVHANDGQSAVDYLEHCHSLPHLLVLDLDLPKLTGFEVLERVREQPRFASVPVIILSSADHPENKARAAALGARAYIGKTDSFHEFIVTIMALLPYPRFQNSRLQEKP